MVDRRCLIDTNVFLEVLLLQAKQKDCKKFIEDHFDEIALTQFTLNSIGIGCYRNKRPDLFTTFLNDIVSFLPVLTFIHSAITPFRTNNQNKYFRLR